MNAYFSRATLLALLLSVVAPVANAQDVLWQKVEQQDAETTQLRHSVLLANGDVIVGGSAGTSGSSGNQDYLISRRNGTTGAIVWQRRFNGTGTSETVVDLVADPATGDTWFCGTQTVAGQSGNWLAMKLNGTNGSNGWTSAYTYNGPFSGADVARACAFAKDGAVNNLVVVGSVTYMGGAFGTPGARIAKLNATDGTLMWAVDKSDVQLQDYLNVATTAGGDVFAIGTSFGLPNGNEGMVSKFNAAGAEQWTRKFDGPGTDGVTSLSDAEFTPTGDLVASGVTQGTGNNSDIWIMRVRASDGVQLWQKLINGPANLTDSGGGIAVDATHAYIATGAYRPAASGSDWFLARLNLTNGSYDAADSGWTVTLGGDAAASVESLQTVQVVGGVVYAAGNTQYVTPGRVMTTLKLDATTGAVINRTNFLDRIGAQVASRKGMLVFGNGDMFVAGDSGVSTGFAEIARFGNASAGADANLSALALSAGTLTPAFSAGTQSYTATIGNGVTSITVTPTVAQSGATVRVNGTLVTSGTPSGAIAMSVGLNDISIVVTATDLTTTKTYNLTVERAVCPTCPPPWTSIEQFGNTSTPVSSMARSSNDTVYGLRAKDGGVNGTIRLLRYDTPGPGGTWTTVGEFARTTVTPTIDSLDGEPSLAIDGSGRFHVTFTARSGNSDRVYYATSATGANGSWAFTQVAEISGNNVDIVESVVKTDPTNNLPRIAYATNDANGARQYTLVLLTLTGATWSSTTLVTQTGNNEVRLADIDIDSAGKIHIAFMAESNNSGTDGSLMYVNNVSGSFPAPTNLVAGSTGNEKARSVSLLLDTADKVHIVHSNQTNQLFDTTNVSGAFVSTQLNGSLTGSVLRDSLSRNDFNDIYLEYRNTGIELRYAYLPGGTGSTWLTGLLYRGNSATAFRHSGVVTNTRFGFALFDHRPSGPSGNQELWAAIQLLPAPEIVVQQGTDIADGGTRAYGNVNVGSNASLTFTVSNIGAAPLNVGPITIDGTNAADFSVTTPPTSPVAVSGSTTFVLRFAPGAVGARSAAIHIANNDANENPFDISVSGTGVNTPPSITPAGALTRQRGSSALAAAVATVSDAETAASNLVVTAPTLPTGIAVGSFTNASGNVSAIVTASCSAAIGANTVVLRVADVANATTDGNLTVNVTANTPPTLAYNNQSALPGGSLTVNPSTALGDNGTITSVAVQSPGTYTGTITVNASGVVSLSAIAPSGTHTITIRATDNCGISTDATFTLAVNAPPTVTPAAGLTRQRGTAASVATLGSVADTETAAGSIVVGASAPSGIVLGTLTNTGGVVTSPLSASCTAALGNNTVVLSATDGAGSSTNGNVVVAVTANTAPTLAYGNQIVAPGAALVVTPTTALTDNGTVASIAVQGQGAYTGTISVDTSGVVSVGNAAPAGAHTITIRATDNCGTATDASFELLVNTPPTITPASPSVRQGSPATFTTLATVADGESAAGSLSVNTPTVAPGLTLTGLANNAGDVQANLSAACSGATGPNLISLFAGDGRQGTTANITVDVLANTPPALAYTAQAVVNAGALIVNPATAPSDNGNILNVFVQNQGTYTGTISVGISGVISISNAAPSGTHTITIRAVDNCGTTTDATFTLAVNALPTVTAATGLTRQRGTAASAATLGSVSDVETAAGSITVATSAPAGIVIGTLVNSAGTITAPLSASCTATLGNNTAVLTATDGSGSTGNGNVVVAVTDNTAPTLGYVNQIVAPGAALVVTPGTALSDNGTVASTVVQNPGTYTGTISVEASGVVSVSNAAPAGAHTITIRATDNCGTTTDASFELLVNTPPTITAGTPSVRQGSPPALTTLATVADGESSAGSISVNTPTVAPGLTLTALANNAGSVQANLSAACTATIGANPISLFAGDGRQGTTATINVDVLANTAPTVSYAAQALPLGGSALVDPTAAPADNGSVANIALQSAGSYSGVVSIDSQGRITFANAAPVGTHTVTIRVIDNCGSVTDQPVAVTVSRSSATLSLSTSVSPSRYGQAVILGADLSGTAPTGAIEFLADDVSLGSSPLVGSGDNRSATLTVTTLAVGNPVLKARYAGDAQNLPVEFQLATQLVQAATTRVALSVDANPGAPGNHVISVQVQPNAPGAGTPAGSVNLVSGASNCTATLNAGSGSCALNFAAIGYRTINASFVPSNGNHTASSASTSIVIADGSSSGDVRVRIGNGREYILPGSALTYVVTVDNVGPNAMVARVQVPIAAGLTNASFQCLRAGPAQCGALNGSGDIDTEVQLGPGGLVVYTITAVAPVAPEQPISQSASASVIAPGTDPVPGNNSATDIDPMGLFGNGFEDLNADE